MLALKSLTDKVTNRVGAFNRLTSFSKAGSVTSTSRVGEFAVSVCPTSVDNDVAALARTSPITLTLSQVKSHYKVATGDSAVPLFEYMRTHTPVATDIVFPLQLAVNRYQYVEGQNFEPTAKPSLVAFMTPVMNEAYAPDRTLGNEECAISGRIAKVKQSYIRPDCFMVQLIDEFTDLLVGDLKHMLEPVDVEVVYERQPRPSQQRILMDAECLDTKHSPSNNSFMKSEPYPGPKDPRLITTVDCVDKRDYSRVMYAFEVVLKQHSWYAFGQCPRDIAYTVAAVCTRAEACVINTDFSRFDGHGSNVMRDLERLSLMKAFAPQYRNMVIDLHRRQYGLKVYGRFGTQYDQGFARASGSPETSLFNSLVNAFVAYSCLRRTKRDGAYYSPAEAFSALGIYAEMMGLQPMLIRPCMSERRWPLAKSSLPSPLRRASLA